jgi:hypothetical protein
LGTEAVEDTNSTETKGVDPALAPTLLLEEMLIGFDVREAFIAESCLDGKGTGGRCGGDVVGN